MELKTDPDLKAHIPALRDDEKSILEESIKTEGCREPLVLWKEEGILLDGHNRYEICTRLNIDFETTEISLPDKQTAIAWIEDNQLGRRNLTPDQFRYYLGRKYERAKKDQGGRADREFSDHQNDEPKNTTAQKIAAEHGVGKATVERAADYSKNLDTVAEAAGPEIKQDILSGKEKVTNSELKEIAGTAEETPPADQAEGKQWFQEQKEKINHRAQGTGQNEWYTPLEYIQKARQLLGEIDLDPASSEIANQEIQALNIYTIEEDGLSREWEGRIWLNPPYSQPAISNFADKMVNEWRSGRITSAIVLTHNYTDTRWFQLLASECTAICFTRGRIAFVNQSGEKAAPTQGQAFFYFGDDPFLFASIFQDSGFIVEVK